MQAIFFFNFKNLDFLSPLLADKGILLSATKSELKNTASQFNTTEYFTRRSVIAEAMFQAVGKVMSSRFCKVEQVRLRAITFPKDIENQLVNKVRECV